MKPEQYEESLASMKPRVFMNGEIVSDILANRNIRTVIEANKANYGWALDPRHAELMTCHSPHTGSSVNRYTHVSTSVKDLVKKAEAGTFAAERLGTCVYRCVGCDAMHALAGTTWELDSELGTDYHERFTSYLKSVQEKDLSVAGALTEPRGSRVMETLDWPSPYLSLKVITRDDDGIVVRGAKINISGGFASHELLVLPQRAHSADEKDYAVAFATPADADGITYVCQYTPYSAERDSVDDIRDLGNPGFGQRETSMVIFNDVFVPWDRVFHCGEYRYSEKLVTRFARTHRMTCGGTCKVGFINLIIGASRLIQEYKGLENAAHINDELIEMYTIKETARACGLAAASNGSEEPPGSGVFLPDEVMGNVAKLNVCNSFWRVMALAGDIGGGLIVTLPSLSELRNPDVKDSVNEFYSFGSEEPTEDILKVHKLLQNWTAGMHGVGTWHGAGPPQTQKIMLQRSIDYGHEKKLVRRLLDLKGRDGDGVC